MNENRVAPRGGGVDVPKTGVESRRATVRAREEPAKASKEAQTSVP